MNFLGQQPEQKLDYDLPFDPPNQPNEVIISQADNSLKWDLLPASSNVQQLDIFDEDLDLSSWSQTFPPSIAPFNNRWKVLNSGPNSSGLWSICNNTSTMMLAYRTQPDQGPVGQFGEFNLAGGLNATSIQHLYKTVDISAFNEPFDQTKFEVFLGGYNSLEFEWDVYVYVTSVAKPDPVYDTNWTITSGLSPDFTGVITGKMQRVTIDLSQASVCNSQFIQVVLQAKLSSNGFAQDEYQTLPSRYGMSCQHARMFGLFTSSSLGTVVPVSQIDHNLIMNVGINSHAALDAHKADMESKIDQSLLITGTPTFNGINLTGAQKWTNEIDLQNSTTVQVLFTLPNTGISDRTVLCGDTVLSLRVLDLGGSILQANSNAVDLLAGNAIDPTPSRRISMTSVDTIFYDNQAVEKLKISPTGVLLNDKIVSHGIEPLVDNLFDLGLPLKKYKNVYSSGTVYAQNLQMSDTFDLNAQSCMTSPYIAGESLLLGNIVKIVDDGIGNAVVIKSQPGDVDSIPILGVCGQDAALGMIVQVCIGGRVKILAENGHQFLIGEPVEKSDISVGVATSNIVGVGSVGAFAVALDNVLGTGVNYVTCAYIKNEMF